MNEHDRRSHEILGDPTVWAETPDVLDDVLTTIEGRRGPAVRRSGRTLGQRRGPATPGTLGSRRALWVPAAVAVVGLVIALGAFLASRDEPVDFTLAGTNLAPQATADVRVIETPAGIVLRLEVEGLDPAPPGTYYQGWVVSEDTAVSVGTFHMRGGDGSVAFWSGVETDRYPTLIVTLQDERAGPARSDTIVLTGRA